MTTKDFIQGTADKIVESLKNGTAPFVKPWKAEDLYNAMPYNPITNKPYNGINSINLMLEGYNDPRWLTFKQAQSINANVKKGEKSTLIQYWQFTETVDKIDEEGNLITNEKGEVEKIEIELVNPKVFFANVFNAEQILNMPKLENKPIIDNFKVIENAEKIIKNSGATIHHKNDDTAYYNSYDDEIILPNKENFISEGAYYAVALHELGHWTGNENRLNRDLSNPFGSKEYAKEELRAEIGSFLFNGRLGLDYEPGMHLSYINNWVQILEDKPNEIFKATADATKIVSYLENLSLELKQDLQIENSVNQNLEAKNNIDFATKNTYLYVPFLEKDEAKNAGAKWDKEIKAWYAPKGSDLNRFEKWKLPQEQEINQLSNLDYLAEFKIALEKAGLIIEGDPIMNGKIQRVAVDGDKLRQKSGSYVGFDTGHPAGYIQNYKSGFKENWKSSITSQGIKDQDIDVKNRMEENKALREQRNQELESAHEKTALKLQEEYDNAKYAYNKHPYLIKKGFDTNFYLKQDKNGNLLIPLKDINGKHWASQRIFSNGDKMIGATRTPEEKEQGIEYPAKKQGNFFILGTKNLHAGIKEVFVCEGFATAASVHLATSKPTVMAVDAGNLEIVITNIKEKFPKMEIIIAADNDIKKELEGSINVGKTTALGIQEKYPDVKVALPQFTREEVSKGFSDYNDIHKSRGLEEIKKQLKEQIAKNLSVEKATTQSKGINKSISTTKDISLSV
ncbi:zincin-like metallopeptidase domain-containing protein [Aliarcobacter butzleri]|uniref:zincin-like metallopeptidase domain-containing protein n=1 Tax=Aliarcobacter butzleri TaxID=28197 RepID=UPI003AE88FC8